MATERVTEVIVLAESEAESAVAITRAGALAEMVSQQLRVTKAGILAEITSQQVRLTKLGVLVELQARQAPGTVEMSTYRIKGGGSRQLLTKLPDEVTGYALDPGQSWWSVIVPEMTENLIKNPSFESGFDNFSVSGWASSAIVGGDAVGAVRGAYALRITNTASVAARVDQDTPSLPPGGYTFSCDVYVPSVGAQLELQTTVSSNTQSKVFTFRRAGWQRIEVTRVTLAAGVWGVSLLSPDTNTQSYAFRTDGWQLENKKYSTTYADGDMSGWFDTIPHQSYYWTGVPHQSSSVRKANTGTGGRIVYFSDLVGGVDFQSTALVGTGMAPVELDTARVGYEKEAHKGVRILPRDFTITGRIIACDFANLRQARQALIGLLRPNRTLTREPLILRYQETYDNGVEATYPLEIVCAYKDGLQGNITNLFQETIGLQFHASNPFWAEEFESAVDLGTTPYESLVSNRIVYRDADGIYQNLGTGATDAEVQTVTFDADGVPLAGGVFTTLCGDTVSYLAQWNGTNWVAINGDEPDATVNVIDVIPETNVIIIGGEFSDIGGSGANRAAYFDGSNWNELAGGFSTGEVEGLVYDRYSGNIFEYGAGDGSTSYTFYAALDDVAWTSLPNGGLSGVHAMLSTHDGYIWFGGDFTETEDTSVQMTRVGRYNIDDDSWEALDAGMNGSVKRLVRGRDGYVYAFGAFSADGDNNYDLRSVARWNGSTWEEPFSINKVLVTPVAAFDTNNVLWYGDADVNGFTLPQFGELWWAGWTNGVDYPSPFRQPDDADGLSDLAFGPNNEMLVAVRLSSATETLAPTQVTVDVAGDADSLPIIVLRNRQSPQYIQNLDAAVGLYFRNDFRVVDNERLFINFSGSRPRFYSDVRPNLVRHIYTGASNIGSFVLRPGTNRINIFCTGDDGAVGISNSLIWRNRYLSSDAVERL